MRYQHILYIPSILVYITKIKMKKLKKIETVDHLVIYSNVKYNK